MSEINLNEISAADFLAAVEDGTIDLDQMSVENEKVAGEEFDLSEISTEDLLAALEDSDSGENEKTAEAQYFEDVGRMMARGYADELTKVANGGLDLNELSVDQFIEYAANLEGEMSKEALAMPSKNAILDKLRGAGKAVGSAYNIPKTYRSIKRDVKTYKNMKKMSPDTPKDGEKYKAHGARARNSAIKSALKSTAAYGAPAVLGHEGYKKFKKSRK